MNRELLNAELAQLTALVLPQLTQLRPYEPGKPEGELARELGLSRIIKLASNENPLGPSPKAQLAAQNALAELHRYPDGNGFELKQTLAALHGVDSAQITLGNGSNDILELIARTFLAPSRSAIFSRHAFAVYPITVQAVGALAKVSAALPSDHPAMPYGHDLAAMERLIDERVSVIFIANPNNPTGTWLELAAIEDFLNRVPSHIIVVLDEAYYECAQVPNYATALSLLPRFPRLIVTRSFSKMHGLANLRVGYSVSSFGVADYLNRVRQPFNVNGPALAAAAAAVTDTAHLENSRRNNQQGLIQLQQGFDELGLRYLPTAGNFICVELPQLGRRVFNELLRHGIIVRPIDGYELPQFIRVTIGRPDENAAFLHALAAVLTALRNQ